MVADEVEVVSRRAGEDKASRWVSTGAGEYSLEDAERDEAGTTIRMTLKPVDGDNGIPDFCDEWVLRQTIKKYSDFVGYPIKLTIIEEATASAEAEGETADEGEDRTTATGEGLPSRREIEDPINSMKAIWTRPEGEVDECDFRRLLQTHYPRFSGSDDAGQYFDRRDIRGPCTSLRPVEGAFRSLS